MALFLTLLFIVVSVLAYAFKAKWINSPLRFAVIGGLLVLPITAIVIQASKDRVVEPVWQEGSIQWSSGPVSVFASTKDYPDGLDDAINKAIARWNEVVGCEVLWRNPLKAGSLVIVHPDDQTVCGPGIDEGKSTAHTYYCSNGTADVQTGFVDNFDAYVVFLHEFGHVLGLAHDPSGIMQPHANGDPSPVNTWISSKDSDALRARYCR